MFKLIEFVQYAMMKHKILLSVKFGGRYIIYAALNLKVVKRFGALGPRPTLTVSIFGYFPMCSVSIDQIGKLMPNSGIEVCVRYL